jgi:hypothetical protein
MSPAAGPTARATPACTQNGRLVDTAVVRPGYHVLPPLRISAAAANAAARRGHGDRAPGSPRVQHVKRNMDNVPGPLAPDASLPRHAGKGTDVVRAAVN